jgi:hypothetical protein
MVLPSSGALSLNQIQTEFGGSNPIGLNEYYRGGNYVSSTITAIPASGVISIFNFYGTGRTWPCLNLYSYGGNPDVFFDSGTVDTYGEYFTPPAGSFTFYFEIVPTPYNTTTMYLYRGATLLTSMTTSGTYTTTLQATQHRFRMVTSWSSPPDSQDFYSYGYWKQTNSSGCIIQKMEHNWYWFNP